jgi:hypothetical protein
MDILEVERIRTAFINKAKRENYTNPETIEICILATEALNWYEGVNTEADELTFGECTRRFEKAIKGLKEILLL